MGHRAQRRNLKIPVAQGARRSHTTADIGRSGAHNRSIRSLSPAGTKFHYRPALGSPDDSVGLGGDQALMVDAKQDHRFHKLSLDHRSAHGDNGLARKNRPALWHRPDIAGKLEIL